MTSTPAIRVLTVALCLLAGWMYLSRASQAEVLPYREPLANLPLSIEDRTGRNARPFDKAIVDVLGVDDYLVRTYYQRGSMPIGLYVGFYASQRQGDTIHSPLNCLPGAGWQPVEQGRTIVTVRQSPASATTRSIEVNRVVIGKGLERQLVLYWYQSRDRVVASEYWGKIYTVLDAVKYNRTDAALVRVVIPIPDASFANAANAQGIQFVQALFPLLERHLPI